MLSSTDGHENETNYNKPPTRLNTRESSSTSSSSSSPSPLSPLPHLHTQTQRPSKTMEEVWKDINLASLHDYSSSRDQLALSVNPRVIHNNPHHHNPTNFIFQDFLARPFSKDPPTKNGDAAALYGSQMPPPATVLSLNSGPGFDFLDSPDPLRSSSSRLQSNAISNLSVFSCPFDALASSSGFSSFGKKRVHESDSINSGDRRQKRMIKNRESAARSRARKQAYTYELELEIAHLKEENERLRRQHEQIRLAAAAQVAKKHTLHRTSTAPF